MKYDLSQCEALIVSIAKRWAYKLSPNSIYTMQDLISEGWIVYLRCLDKPINDAAFSTYLYEAITNEFKRINIKERDLLKSKCETVSMDDEDVQVYPTTSYYESPERMAMLAEGIVALSEVSVGFAKMITDCAPKELVSIARRNMRAKRFRKHAKHEDVNISLMFTQRMIEDFFYVNLEFLRDLLSNYI